MARPRKQGLDYFPFDVDFFSDIKVRKLMRNNGGGKAVIVYTLLLCSIYRNGYYMLWDEELPFMLSETSGFEEGYVREVIAYCVSVGLFDRDLFKTHRVLTSHGIQLRYKLICEQSRRACKITDYSLVSSEETTVSSEFSTQSKVNERKVKENKEKISLSDSLPSVASQGREDEREREIDFESFKTFFNRCVSYYHSAIRPLQHISANRQRALLALLNTGYTKAEIQAVVTKATASPQLNGRGKNAFKNIPSFDWIFEEKNFVRILEGCFNQTT